MLTPVSAPGLWADARQGAAGGGLADLEAQLVGRAFVILVVTEACAPDVFAYCLPRRLPTLYI